MPREGEPHKKIRTEILPRIGNRLAEEGLIKSHAGERISIRTEIPVAEGTSLPYSVIPDYVLTFSDDRKVIVEVVGVLGEKGILGNVMVPYILTRFHDDIVGCIFLLAGYDEGETAWFTKKMAVAMAMLTPSVNRKPLISIVNGSDEEKLHSDIRKCVQAYNDAPSLSENT